MRIQKHECLKLYGAELQQFTITSRLPGLELLACYHRLCCLGNANAKDTGDLFGICVLDHNFILFL